jgi:hypothetical protein
MEIFKKIKSLFQKNPIKEVIEVKKVGEVKSEEAKTENKEVKEISERLADISKPKEKTLSKKK